MKKEIEYLGIDIGGVHIKIIGLNDKKEVCYVKYLKCHLWKGIDNLKKVIKFINTLITNKKNKCCITMTGELCDTFRNRRSSPKEQVIVAVVDTGVDYTHPDLKASIWINQEEIPEFVWEIILDLGSDLNSDGYMSSLEIENFLKLEKMYF